MGCTRRGSREEKAFGARDSRRTAFSLSFGSWDEPKGSTGVDKPIIDLLLIRR